MEKGGGIRIRLAARPFMTGAVRCPVRHAPILTCSDFGKLPTYICIHLYSFLTALEDPAFGEWVLTVTSIGPYNVRWMWMRSGRNPAGQSAESGAFDASLHD